MPDTEITSAAKLLADRFPPLGEYWPNLSRASAPQAAFLVLDHAEAFYGGAAGGGKSDALLAAALQYVNVPRYAALILRRSYTDLSLPGAVMSRAEEWLHGKAHWSHERKTWTFPSGATLSFAYLATESDMYRYKSAEFQFIAFDELTQFTERQYRYLFTRLRATEDVPVPLRMRAASNPGDVGHGWVKRRFITEAEPGTIFVPAKLDDHPDETFKAGYRESLSNLDEVTRRQYEDGDWDVAEGLAFDVRKGIHLVSNVEIDDGWDRQESMDFGVANPTCVLAWASDYDGNNIVFDCYYSDPNTLTSAHARAIEAKRKIWWADGKSPVCYADPSMWSRNGRITSWGEPASDVTEFIECGIDGLVQANNRRRPGRIRISELLKQDPNRIFPSWHPRAGEPGAPRLFIVEDACPELVEQAQSAPLLSSESAKEGAGEIVDPDWETRYGHATAALRYGAMARPSPTPEPEQVPDDPKIRLLLEHEARLERDTRSRRRYQNV